MHIIFTSVSNWQISLIKLLKFFKFKIFYLYIESKSEFQRNEIATQLKKKNITPLPFEFASQIQTAHYSAINEDYNEYAYKKNIKMIPDKILKKYSKLFSIHENEVNKLRLLIQDFISGQRGVSTSMGMWSSLHPLKKIILISFKFKDFFTFSDVGNMTKIIIPIDVFYLFKKIFKSKKNKKTNNYIFNHQNFKDSAKKNVAFIAHKGTIYGSKEEMLFQKTLYYSDDKKSFLNKHNILHLDYNNYPNPDKDLHWINLNKVNVSNTKVFFQIFLACAKTFYLIRSWSTFLVWIYLIQQYVFYIKYSEVIKKFKELKIAIIDYDCLCPKALILACKKNNIKTVATQERFITTFYTSFSNVTVDTYYTASEFTANAVKKSKYYDVKNVVPMGQYRSDYISLYKKETVPNEISIAKNNGKKILIIFGNHSNNCWFDSHIDPLLNWTAQLNFLEDCIKLSRNLSNTFIVIRYKSIGWLTNKFFKNILDKINNCENIIISNNYKESYYSYKLCANADLVIAKHTSIADECLANEIPVLFHDYTHNTKKTLLAFINYLPDELICSNFDELYQRTKSILFSNSSKLGEEIKKLNQTVYFVKKKENIKKSILENLENQLIKNGL